MNWFDHNLPGWALDWIAALGPLLFTVVVIAMVEAMARFGRWR